MFNRLNNYVLASVLNRKDLNFLRQNHKQLLVVNTGVEQTLHYEALYLVSESFLFTKDYKEAFQCGFFLKEINGNSIKARKLLLDIIFEFAENEREHFTVGDVALMIEEVKTQCSFLKIQGFNDNIIQKFSVLVYYLNSIKEGISENKEEGKHQMLFNYLRDLFLRSNSSIEAWDRVALIIIGTKS